MRSRIRHSPLVALALVLLASPAGAQGRGGGLTLDQVPQRWDLERQLESLGVIDRKVMVTMRDGKRMAADVCRPRDATRTYPTIFSPTPYNFNYWDVRNGVPRAMTTELDAVRRGYSTSP